MFLFSIILFFSTAVNIVNGTEKNPNSTREIQNSPQNMTKNQPFVKTEEELEKAFESSDKSKKKKNSLEKFKPSRKFRLGFYTARFNEKNDLLGNHIRTKGHIFSLHGDFKKNKWNFALDYYAIPYKSTFDGGMGRMESHYISPTVTYFPTPSIGTWFGVGLGMTRIKYDNMINSVIRQGKTNGTSQFYTVGVNWNRWLSKRINFLVYHSYRLSYSRIKDYRYNNPEATHVPQEKSSFIQPEIGTRLLFQFHRNFRPFVQVRGFYDSKRKIISRASSRRNASFQTGFEFFKSHTFVIGYDKYGVGTKRFNIALQLTHKF